MAGGDEVCPAKGGDGPTSYGKNSTKQRASVDAAKELVNKAIEEKFDVEILLASNTGTFRMADLGCSTGPNTFSAVESILEAVKLNSQVTKDLEFQVFFNDLTSNDFNMLFKSLPLNREYYAAGVPGSFYGRLFPNNSLHLVYSSSSIPWLSRVPKAVEDRSSPAWNKGKIQYSHSSDEAIRAFEAQYGADMESFLTARAEEIVYGGLMVLVVQGRPDGTCHSECSVNVLFHLLGSCLMEMATKKGAVDATKEVISKAIAEKLDLEMLLASGTTFRIADLGCSIGPNTFSAVENILEAVKLKCQANKDLEFQVFFNDHTSNDFNMLFKSLPLNREYYAAGVPGSFYGRVFAKDSLHFVYSSTAIHWLSRVPKDVKDRNSPAWNKGKIGYSHSSDEVIRAFKAQFSEDIEFFLNARAQEIVCGGFMSLVVLGRPYGISHQDSSLNLVFHLLGSCLMEMVKRGVVNEEKADGFNLPMYYMSSQELKDAVKLNGNFTIECVEDLPRLPKTSNDSKKAQVIAAHIRAATEGLFQQEFGDEILDELYGLYVTKIEEQFSISGISPPQHFLFVLKRQ